MKNRSAPGAPRARRGLGIAIPAALACAALGSVTSAQGMSSSESGFTPVQILDGAGGLSVTVTGNQATSSLSQVGAGAEATSDNYVLQDGFAWSPTLIPATGPIVTGVRVASGDKDGGDAVTVFGFNFDLPGSGIPDVQFDGLPGTNPSVASSTMIDVTTPAALNSLGNPLGVSGISVTNALGADDAEKAFYFEPALVQANHAQIGRALELRVQTQANAIPLFVFGLSIPDFGIATPPFDGQLECILDLLFVSASFAPAPTGATTLKIQLPDDEDLAGAVLEFQVIALDDFTLTSGSWSNRLPVTILL